jgi:uncharacterized repeat protein (TIGR01451 family)
LQCDQLINFKVSKGDKYMSRLLRSAVAALAVVPVLAISATAVAAGGGQIEGGDIYRVQNNTKGSDFVDSANADAGDTLTYKVRIHNPGQECLSNTVVKAALPTGANQKNVSTITVHADNATTNNISDTATVNVSSAQKIDFVPGSVQLLDANGALLSKVSDSAVNGNGANIGQVCISINNKRFVQFQAKVEKPAAPTPTPAPTPAPTPTAIPAPAKAPEVLPNTGAGDVLGAFAGASAAGTAAHAAIRRVRRNK